MSFRGLESEMLLWQSLCGRKAAPPHSCQLWEFMLVQAFYFIFLVTTVLACRNSSTKKELQRKGQTLGMDRELGGGKVGGVGGGTVVGM